MAESRKTWEVGSARDKAGTRQEGGSCDVPVRTGRPAGKSGSEKPRPAAFRPETSRQNPEARMRVVLRRTHGPLEVPNLGDLIPKFIGAFVSIRSGSVSWAGTCKGLVRTLPTPSWTLAGTGSRAGRAGQCNATQGSDSSPATIPWSNLVSV